MNMYDTACARWHLRCVRDRCAAAASLILGVFVTAACRCQPREAHPPQQHATPPLYRATQTEPVVRRCAPPHAGAPSRRKNNVEESRGKKGKKPRRREAQTERHCRVPERASRRSLRVRRAVSHQSIVRFTRHRGGRVAGRHSLRRCAGRQAERHCRRFGAQADFLGYTASLQAKSSDLSEGISVFPTIVAF